MPLGMLDLSIVTDRLIEQLTGCTRASGLWNHAARFGITYTGLAPDAARAKDGCQVSIYLFHVAVEKFHRNTFPLGGSAQTIPEQPLALTLYYLLTAHSGDYIEEQRAMSIALKCLHEHSTVRMLVPEGATNRREELILTIEPQTVDEIARLWQAIASPLRLSAVYRASVVFMEAPPQQTPEAVRHVPSFEPPWDIQPFKTVPGPPVTSVTVDETGFAAITVDSAGFAAGVTAAWLRSLELIETLSATGPLLGRHYRVVDPDTLHLRVPLHTPAGQYLLTLKPTADRRTFGVQLIVEAPIVTVKVDAAGRATIWLDDAHFAAGAAVVQLDQVALAETTTGPPAAGQFRVVPKDTLEVRVPASTPRGRHLLHVRPAAGKPTVEIWLDVP